MMAKNKSFFIIPMRILALGAMVSAIVVMVTSHQSTTVLNLTFTAKYTNDPVFKYFVVAEAIAGGYSLLVLIFFSKQSRLWRLIIILDVVVTALLVSSISAALAIAYVGKKGNSHAGWLPICSQVPKFCNHVTGSLVSGFAAAIIYLLLLLSSLHSILTPDIPLNP